MIFWCLWLQTYTDSYSSRRRLDWTHHSVKTYKWSFLAHRYENIKIQEVRLSQAIRTANPLQKMNKKMRFWNSRNNINWNLFEHLSSSILISTFSIITSFISRLFIMLWEVIYGLEYNESEWWYNAFCTFVLECDIRKGSESSRTWASSSRECPSHCGERSSCCFSWGFYSTTGTPGKAELLFISECCQI